MAPPTPASSSPPRGTPGPGKGSGFGKKIGPLPAWAWAGFLLGAVAFLFIVRGRTKPKTADTGTGDKGLTIFQWGGGAPSPPANGVKPGRWHSSGHLPSHDETCPPGMVRIGGLCTPGPSLQDPQPQDWDPRRWDEPPPISNGDTVTMQLGEPGGY